MGGRGTTWTPVNAYATPATTGRRRQNQAGKPAYTCYTGAAKRRWQVACLKCGSAWVTKKGKDKLSCPECCKQQRAKARRQGRLEKEVHRPCEMCGTIMTVSGSVICSTRYCDRCKPLARKESKKRYQERVMRGDPPVRVASRRRAARKCLHCEKTLGPNQKKYCNQSCYHAARNAGTQSWDRTNQLEANVRRCGIQIFPSKKGLSAVLGGFSGFMVRLRALQRRVATLHCLVCDKIATEGSRFCSEECCVRFQFSTVCKRCGCEMMAKGGMGPKRRLCEECKAIRRKDESRAHKQRYGRNHRQRARYHGVQYVSFPVRVVFERDGYVCQICRKKTLPNVMYRKKNGKIHPRSPTIDHIIPMAKGGPHRIDNAQCACFRCNSLKGSAISGQLLLPIKSS